MPVPRRSPLTARLSSRCSSMNEVVHTSPTIGSNVEEIVVNNTRFLMWDIGGQESLRSSWNTYYTNTEVRAGACRGPGGWRSTAYRDLSSVLRVLP